MVPIGQRCLQWISSDPINEIRDEHDGNVFVLCPVLEAYIM